MNFNKLAVVLGFLAPGIISAQDAPKEAPKTEKTLEYAVEKGGPAHLPLHSSANHGMALAIIEKVQSETQEKENKLAAEQKRSANKIAFSPEEEMWYAETQLNRNGVNGVEIGDLLEFIAGNDKYKGLTAKKVNSAIMSVQVPNFAYKISDNTQEKLDQLIAEKAKEANAENTPLFQAMIKAKIAKAYSAKKINTHAGQSILITKEMVANFEKDKANFYLPGVLDAEKPEAPKEASEAEKNYIVDFTVKFAPVVGSFGHKYVEMKSAYNKKTKAEVPQTEEDRTYMLSLIAGDDNILDGTELDAKIKSLEGKIAELGDSKDFNWGNVALRTETEIRGYAKVAMEPKDLTRMKEAAEKYSLTPAQQLVWLRNNYTPGKVKGEGSMTKVQVDSAIKALDEQYKGDKK